MTDALGNKIEIGKLYGYSNRSNGVVTIVIGHAEKTNDSSVTLRVVKRGKSIYNNDIKEDKGRMTSSVSGNSLFPLQSDKTFWIVNEAKELLMK